MNAGFVTQYAVPGSTCYTDLGLENGKKYPVITMTRGNGIQ